MKKHTGRVLSALLAGLLLLSSLASCTDNGGETETTGGSAETTDAVVTTPTTDPAAESATDPETEPETEAPDLSIKLIVDGTSAYAIDADTELGATAAYTLREQLSKLTGVTMDIKTPLTEATTDKPAGVLFRTADASETGNYGYKIAAGENSVTVSAASLAGFDMGIARLLTDTVIDGLMKVPEDYLVGEKLDWATEYKPANVDYIPSYTDGDFYNDKNDNVAYVSNAMWHMFGLVNDGQGLVYQFGNEPTWFEWIAEKVAWSQDTGYINGIRVKLLNFAQTSTGYMWSWGNRPYWQVDECYSIHYDGTFRYIAAVYDIISWDGNTSFLTEVDYTAETGDRALDASYGKTILEKTEACMNYILEYLHGKDGYILITEESTYLDETGKKRFDLTPAGTYCWNNTGRDNSTASNYWDNLCFGNYDAYENALFYNALQSMAGIYRMLGGDYIAKAEEMEALAVKVKEKYNELYWSEETGRYIGCIDVDGRRIDYGFTFLNFEAMKYGLADTDRAQTIFDWIDGDRIVEGDDRTGTDILSYAANIERANRRKAETARELGLRFAATANTLAINRMENRKEGIAWWHGPSGIDPFGSASYGRHLENGGYIFYPMFYELMARTEFEGAQSTTERLADIAGVYEFNRLISDEGNWVEGLIGEFPESGLVPTAYVYSLVGATASYDGLHITPAFNDVYEFMGVRTLRYGGKYYGIEVNRNGSMTVTATNGDIDMTLHYTPARFSSMDYTVSMVFIDGSTSDSVLTPNENGVLQVMLKGDNVAKVVITPIIK